MKKKMFTAMVTVMMVCAMTGCASKNTEDTSSSLKTETIAEGTCEADGHTWIHFDSKGRFQDIEISDGQYEARWITTEPEKDVCSVCGAEK